MRADKSRTSAAKTRFVLYIHRTYPVPVVSIALCWKHTMPMHALGWQPPTGYPEEGASLSGSAAGRVGPQYGARWRGWPAARWVLLAVQTTKQTGACDRMMPVRQHVCADPVLDSQDHTVIIRRVRNQSRRQRQQRRGGKEKFQSKQYLQPTLPPQRKRERQT